MVLAPEQVLGAQEPARPSLPITSVEVAVYWVLCAVSAGPAVIHFAYAPSHFDQYWMYGLFFVVVAWVQLLWAVGIVVRPDRRLYVTGAVVNAAVIGVWALSRTVGVWVGPDAVVTEPATFPDILATLLEALVVVGSLLLLGRVLTRRAATGRLAPIAAGVTFVLVAGTAAYATTPRFAAAHSGHSHAGLSGDTPCEKSGPPVSEGQVFDSAGHFHRGPTAQEPIDQATRVELEAQQTQARAVAEKYPTVADAERAGYRESTLYVPCIGAHYTNAALAGGFDPAAPSELLYDGTSPGARIVGLSYLVYHPGGPPEGFAGPNDRWHQHTFNGGLCISPSGLVIGAESTTPAGCSAMGGRKVPLTDIWMLHDWVVPGFECSWGVFAAECPELGGRIGGSPWG